jgi:hypothetical protein
VLIAMGPVIGNQLIQLMKDLALLSIITVPELTFAANYVESYYFGPFESFLAATLLYWALCSGSNGSFAAAKDGRSWCGPAMLDCSQTAPVVELCGVGKFFGGHEVLAKVDLSVAAGESVCILRPSGAGKSTLLPCINWLETPDSGAVFLHGVRVGVTAENGVHRPMTDRELAAIRTRTGMVFQHFNLWPPLTVLGNVIESPIHVLRRPHKEVV